MRRRLDAELVRRGMVGSRSAARALIDDGRVLVAGAPAPKAARQVAPGEPVVVLGEPDRYVGRGAYKLEAALDAFGLDPSGLRVLDAGASTGGFTDVLLQRGAQKVVALDVGHGQLHERLRGDERVVVMERTNVRHIDPNDLGPFDAVVADLSFISLTKVMEVLVACCAPGGWMVLLAKPQFEAGRREVSRGGGVVRDPEQWHLVLDAVLESAAENGAVARGVVPSPLPGADGNVEFLVHLERTTDAGAGAARAQLVIDAVSAGCELAGEAGLR